MKLVFGLSFLSWSLISVPSPSPLSLRRPSPVGRSTSVSSTEEEEEGGEGHIPSYLPPLPSQKDEEKREALLRVLIDLCHYDIMGVKGGTKWREYMKTCIFCAFIHV